MSNIVTSIREIFCPMRHIWTVSSLPKRGSSNSRESDHAPWPHQCAVLRKHARTDCLLSFCLGATPTGFDDAIRFNDELSRFVQDVSR
jgi:hypothetical protein